MDPVSDLYHVSSSPHVRSKDTTSKIMLYVIIALLPTSLFGIYNFGIRALILILVTIASCVASEWIFNKIVHKKNSIDDLSAVVTGLLLALNLPASLPWWEAAIADIFHMLCHIDLKLFSFCFCDRAESLCGIKHGIRK